MVEASDKVRALIEEFEGLGAQLQDRARPDEIDATLKTATAAVKEAERQAIAAGEEAKFQAKAGELAGSFRAIRDACAALTDAPPNGDPFANSARIVGLAGPAISALRQARSAGALLEGILSVVSMTLEAFRQEAIFLSMQATPPAGEEQPGKDLRAAATLIEPFASIVRSMPAPPDRKDYTYRKVVELLDPAAMARLSKAQDWLASPDHRELAQWSGALAAYCLIYSSFRVGLAYWLTIVQPDKENPDPVPKLIERGEDNDQRVSNFLQWIKPLTQNRGLIFTSNGSGDIGFRDVAISKAKAFKKPEGHAWAVAAAYKPRYGEPELSVFHLGGPEPTDEGDVRKRPFTKKAKAYEIEGQWPLGKKWTSLPEIEKDGSSDIWAISGVSAGEINIYTAGRSSIQSYTHTSGEFHAIIAGPSFACGQGFEVGAVRAVRPKAVGSHAVAVYALCRVDSKYADGPRFQIVAFLPKGRIRILLPTPPGMVPGPRTEPIGIAIDSTRLWVFGTPFYACVPHADIIAKRETSSDGEAFLPNWIVHTFPLGVLDYDPVTDLKGITSMSPCDDGTLTAVFQEKDRTGRIFTATMRFKDDELSFDPDNNYEDLTAKHGWLKDPQAKARQVHKLPVFFWPAFEGLANAVARSGA